MAEQQKPSWWQTAPGMLTALAAFMAALTGLLGGLNQAGLLDRFKRSPTAPTQSAAAPRRADSMTGTLGAEGRSAPSRPRTATRPSTRIPTPPKKSTAIPARPPAPPPASSSPAADTTAPTRGAETAAPTRSADTAAPPRGADTTARALPPPAPPAAPPAAPAPAPAPAPTSGALPKGTVLELAASSRICSTTSQPGDRFTAAVVVPVVGRNGLVLPVGTSVILEVLHPQAPVFVGARADTLSFGGRSYALQSSAARTQRELVAGAAEHGVALGACIPAGGRITATLDAGVTVGQP